MLSFWEDEPVNTEKINAFADPPTTLKIVYS